MRSFAVSLTMWGRRALVCAMAIWHHTTALPLRTDRSLTPAPVCGSPPYWPRTIFFPSSIGNVAITTAAGNISGKIFEYNDADHNMCLIQSNTDNSNLLYIKHQGESGVFSVYSWYNNFNPNCSCETVTVQVVYDPIIVGCPGSYFTMNIGQAGGDPAVLFNNAPACFYGNGAVDYGFTWFYDAAKATPLAYQSEFIVPDGASFQITYSEYAQNPDPSLSIWTPPFFCTVCN